MFNVLKPAFSEIRKRLRHKSRQEAVVSADGIAVTQDGAQRRIDWSDINRIVAFRHDIYIGLVVCIAIEALDGFTLYIQEGDAAYDTLFDALTRALPTILPLGQWFLALSQGRIEVAKLYDRPDVPT